MFTSLAISVMLSIRLGEPPQPGLPFPPTIDPREYRRRELDLCRDRRSIYEVWNAKFERHIANLSNNRVISPRSRDRLIDGLMEDVEQRRGDIEFMRRYERELEAWEDAVALNPGPETDAKAMIRIRKVWKEEADWHKAWEAGRVAPMPREVKR